MMTESKLRFWDTQHSHSFCWDKVASGYWFRYPNQHSSHVFSVDTLDTKIVDGKLYARRLIIKTNPLPSWGKHFFAARRVAVIEECIVEPSQQKLTWYTRNIGLGKFMSTVEKATLTQSPKHQHQTDVTKQAWIGSSIIGFRSAIKRFGIDRYKKNCILATEGFETVLQQKYAQQPSTTSNTLQQSNKSECPFAKMAGNESSDKKSSSVDSAANEKSDLHASANKKSDLDSSANRKADINLSLNIGQKQTLLL